MTPKARIVNLGTDSESFPVRLRIISTTDTVYNDDTTLTIGAGGNLVIDFNPWTAIPGSFNVLVRTSLFGDQNPENDVTLNNFTVTEVGWQKMADVPTEPSGKYPKNGSCLAGLNGNVYLLKANNTPDFYRFTPNPELGTWTPLTPMPLGNKEHGDGKNPKKGAMITAYNNTVYVLRGNNTSGFWAYDINGAGWRKLKDIPPGSKNPKGGSGLVYVNKSDTDYIFAMKGSKTAEFYLYDINSDNWQQVASPPNGASGKAGYKEGSCLAYDGDSLVYVLKGNYGDFFQYNVLTNTWTELKRLDPTSFRNRENKKTKVKAGAGLVYLNRANYLIKGGNTLEFWKYDISANTWLQMNPATIWDIPLGSGKKVKSGGSLCRLDNFLYALKGNNTLEFYRHGPPSNSGAMEPYPESSFGIMEENSSPLVSTSLIITPNPARKMVKISYSLSKPSNIELAVFDNTGRLVKILDSGKKTPKTYSLSWNKRDEQGKKLAQGIYFLRLKLETSPNATETKKLIITE